MLGTALSFMNISASIFLEGKFLALMIIINMSSMTAILAQTSESEQEPHGWIFSTFTPNRD